MGRSGGDTFFKDSNHNMKTQRPKLLNLKTGIGCFGVFAIIFLVVMYNIGANLPKEPEATKRENVGVIADSKEDEIDIKADSLAVRREIEAGFSELDGSHIELTKRIKSDMNDPDSYEHLSTNYYDVGDTIIVITKFKGTNGFGGIVTNTVRAKTHIDGHVIAIENIQ
jgi:hypothetical protein